MTKRVFIIHGWGSEPNAGWQPWLNNELSQRGFAVRTPAMPNAQHPKLHRWVEELTKMVGTPDRDCHFVGHSLGCAAILRYIESLPEGSHTGNVVLVAGFMDDLGIPEIVEFVNAPFNDEEINDRAATIYSIHSDADPYISNDKFRRLDTVFRTKKIIVKGGGHLSGANGWYTLPEALKTLVG